MPRNSIFVATLIVLSLIAAMSAPAATRTWTGGNTNWNDGSNWGGAVPSDGDAVIIPDLANDPTMPSSSYPASGAFLSFEIQAGVVVICLGDTNVINEASGGIAAKKHGTGVAINCQSATINGTLNADGTGFLGWGPNLQYPGPGYPVNWSITHASHGGCGMDTANTNYRYGALVQPTALGSGAYHTTSPGGGAIKLAVTNTLMVNGRITANGLGSQNSAASGGSVWLICNQFAGTGTISAMGGSRPVNASAGGGGRISIECQSNAFQGAIKVGGGSTTTAVGLYGNGLAQAGTLWFPKWFAGREGTRGNPTNLWLPGPDFGVRYWFADSTVTQYWNVAMTNSWLELYAGSVAISNFAATNSCFWITETNMNNVAVYGSMYLSRCSWINQTNMRNLIISGSIYLTNTTAYLPVNGIYNLSGDFVLADTNTVVYALGDTNIINEASGGTESNKHGAGVTINCRNALINGILNASSNGFQKSAGLGGPGYSGLCGGTYGGQGTRPSGPLIGAGAYGLLTQPTALGSSGAANAEAGSLPTRGGGAIRINAIDLLTLNGIITACGYNMANSSYAGGSGGSIWLACNTLQGNGVVNASGGNGGGGVWGSGGGGRVALEYISSTFSGVILVAGGGYPPALPGKTGTVFLCQSPWLGTATTNGVNGRQLDTQFSVSSNNVRIARSITRFDTSLQWSDISTDTSTNVSVVVTNIATYTISGLRPSRNYAIYRDGTNLYNRLSTSASGVLTFTNTLDMLHTFFVTPNERGTIMTVY